MKVMQNQFDEIDAQSLADFVHVSDTDSSSLLLIIAQTENQDRETHIPFAGVMTGMWMAKIRGEEKN